MTKSGASRLRPHVGPLVFFAVLTIAWTWPLALHVGDAIPGGAGDNFSFVWNLWWLRHVLATPGEPYFHTTFLFHPFGTTIVDHPHTLLPAAVAATALRALSPEAAQNVLLVSYVFANLVCAYALGWAIWRAVRPAVLAAVLFGLSPYLAVHLTGHFDLVAAWTLPLYALCLRRATVGASSAAALAAGAVLGLTAYIAYYYVVYLGVFTAVYLAAWSGAIAFTRADGGREANRRLLDVCAAGAALCGVIALAIVLSGGADVSVAGVRVRAREPQNVLTLMWVLVLVWGVVRWRPRAGLVLQSPQARRAVAILWRAALVFVVVASPLLWQAAGLVLRHEYVTPVYFWRSAPRGVDLLALVAGHPLHPVTGALSQRAYARLGQDFVDAVGWMGLVPLALLVAAWRGTVSRADDVRIWRAVGCVFAVWALGPWLSVGGFDTGLKLPAILLRYIPFVANARMPARAMVGVYLAASILAGPGLNRVRAPAIQWLLIVAVAAEYWAAPIAMTPLDLPPAYAALAAAEPGAACEVPFGIGDGLSTGVGSQDRRSLYYATRHQHPMVGGYIGRMPADAAERYRRLPVAGSLLALSAGTAPPGDAVDEVSHAPCRYLVVHRAASSPALLAYVDRLGPTRLTPPGDVELYRLR